MLSKEECEKALNELKNSDIKLHIYNDQDNIVEEHQPTIYDFFHPEIFALQELIENNKQLQDEVDKYKHEYYAECDRADRLEKALDKACKELARTYPCGVNEYNTNCHPESWKEWCMEDVK